MQHATPPAPTRIESPARIATALQLVFGRRPIDDQDTFEMTQAVLAGLLELTSGDRDALLYATAGVLSAAAGNASDETIAAFEEALACADDSAVPALQPGGARM